MSHATPAPLDRAVHTARAWIADVAAQFDTEDMSFAYRVTRAWLHTVRDRLPVVDAAHFGAQLPEILRGVYYEGWDPAKVPVKYDRGQFTTRFATDARISEADVTKAAHAVSSALDQHLSGHLSVVLEHFPTDLRTVLQPGQPR